MFHINADYIPMVDSDQLLTVSRQMLDYAKTEHWGELSKCYEKRESLIQEYFSSEQSLHQSDVAECLTQMLSLDGELKSLVEANREKVRVELELLSQGRNASKAYSKVGTSH